MLDGVLTIVQDRHMTSTTTRRTIAALSAGVVLVISGCASDADKSSENLSKAAEQFEVQRRIVGVNAITDKPAFEVEGRCSIEVEHGGRVLVSICKHSQGDGSNDVRKHYLGLADNVYWVATQLEGLPVNQFRTRIVIKPENVIPDFDLETSGGHAKGN